MGDRPSGDVRGAVLLRKGEAAIVFTIIGIAGFALLSRRGVETKPAPWDRLPRYRDLQPVCRSRQERRIQRGSTSEKGRYPFRSRCLERHLYGSPRGSQQHGRWGIIQVGQRLIMSNTRSWAVLIRKLGAKRKAWVNHLVEIRDEKGWEWSVRRFPLTKEAKSSPSPNITVICPNGRSLL